MKLEATDFGRALLDFLVPIVLVAFFATVWIIAREHRLGKLSLVAGAILSGLVCIHFLLPIATPSTLLAKIYQLRGSTPQGFAAKLIQENKA